MAYSFTQRRIMTKRAAETELSDFNCKILRNAFQLSLAPSESVIEIYLNDTLAYTTDIHIISHYPSSVMYKSLHAEMSESVTRKVVIHDEEDFYTVNSIKLLFTALTYGAIAIKESPLGAYDTLVLPFLAHYLCIDQNSEVFTACMEQYPKFKCSDNDIEEIISILVPAANKYIECFAADTAEHMFFADVKNKLLRKLACHASHSTDNHQYNWHELNPDDLCIVLQHLDNVKFCMFTQTNNSWSCTIGIENTLLEWEARPDDRIVLKWANESLQLFSITKACHDLPSSTKFYCKWSITYDIRKLATGFTVWRHAWQMRYEIIMAYLRQRYNHKLPHSHKIKTQRGICFESCLCGLIVLRHEDIPTCQSMQTLRDMLIETAALIIGTGNAKRFLDTQLIGELCSLDVVALFACKTFLSVKPSREFDLIKLVITWMNKAPYSENSVKKTLPCDAVAIAKLIIHSIDFSKVRALEGEKREMVQWLTTNAGEAISAEKQKIVDALLSHHSDQPQQPH